MFLGCKENEYKTRPQDQAGGLSAVTRLRQLPNLAASSGNPKSFQIEMPTLLLQPGTAVLKLQVAHGFDERRNLLVVFKAILNFAVFLLSSLPEVFWLAFTCRSLCARLQN